MSPRHLSRAAATVLLTTSIVATPATARADHRADVSNPAASSGPLLVNGRLGAALAARRARIPSYARQTGLACSACHYQFPALTPFGRMFKLNGYTMSGLRAITAGDSAEQPRLKLITVPPISAMFVGSMTHTNRSIDGEQNTAPAFPSEASLFVAGAVAPNVGVFSQFTYTPDDGSFGLDMIDLRWVTRHAVGTHDVLFGLTLHNMPTVQDVWNTLPGYSVPYMSSDAAPGAMASTMLDGGLGMVTGLGAYSMLDNHLYSELTLYRTALTGGGMSNMSSGSTTKGVAPYWRFGWQNQLSRDYLMLGTFGLVASLEPGGMGGMTNKFTDFGFDAQYEHPAGQGAVIGHAAWTHESQDRLADVMDTMPAAQFKNGNLSTFKADISLATSQAYGAAVGYFQTTGSADAILYAPAAVEGSATGSPDTQGFMFEVSRNLFENVRLGLQYTAYTKFNGSSSNYDGSGRSAANNNTLFAYVWLAF